MPREPSKPSKPSEPPAPVLTVRGRVRDAATGAPVAGAEMYAAKRAAFAGASEMPGDGWGSSLGEDGRTDAEGAFALALGPPWWAEGPGGAPVYPGIVEIALVVRAEGYEPFLRNFASEEVAGPLEILLDRGAGCALRGRVVERGTGNGLAGIRVEARVDASGRLASGRLAGEAAAAGRLTDSQAAPGAGLAGEGAPGARLAGEGAAAGERIAGEAAAPRTRVRGASCRPEAVTGVDGGFFLDGLPCGQATVEIARGQGLEAASAGARAAPEPQEVVLEVARAARLAVLVLDAAGRPDPDAHVQVVLPDGVRSIGPGPADDEGGGFRLGSLGPGTYTVKVGLPRGEGAAERREAARRRTYEATDIVETVTLAAGEERTLVLRAGEGGTEGAAGAAPAAAPGQPLTCAVRTPDGSPAGGVKVWLARADADGWATHREAATDGRGVAEFPDVAPGAYKLQASEAWLAPPLATVEVAAAPATVTLDIPLRLRLRGVVRDERGRSVSGAKVRFQEQRGAQADREGTTGPDGRFDLDPLSAGPCFASVEAAGFRRLFFEVIENDGRDLALAIQAGRALVVRGSVPRDRAAGLEGAEVPAWLDLADGTGHGRSAKVEIGGFEIEFEGISASAAGTICLRVGGHVPLRRDVAPDALDIDLGEVPLDPGFAARGRVDDREGWLARGGFSSVSASGDGFEHVHDTRVAGDGTFEVRGLPAGRVKVRISLAEPGLGRSKRWLEAEVEAFPGASDVTDLGLVELRERTRAEER